MRLMYPEGETDPTREKHFRLTRPVDQVIGHPGLRDFLNLMLQIDPAKRASVTDLMRHAFVKEGLVWTASAFAKQS